MTDLPFEPASGGPAALPHDPGAAVSPAHGSQAASPRRPARRPARPSGFGVGVGAQIRQRPRRVSLLTLRILGINVAALGVLILGVLFLGRYQETLLKTEIAALSAEARIFAGALGEGSVIRDVDERYSVNATHARLMIRRLVEATRTRTQLFNRNGVLLTDSNRIVGPTGVIEREVLAPPDGTGFSLRELWKGARRWVGRLLERVPGGFELPVMRPQALDALVRFQPDLIRALMGEVSASAWQTEEGGIMLTAAAPVQRFKEVLGVVLVSRSGDAARGNAREVRLAFLQVFLVSLGLTVLLSLYLAASIARPVRSLAAAADRVRAGEGRTIDLPSTRRGDEVGDLARSLGAMTDALHQRLDAIERFAADVAHELKNPLTSLRSAIETFQRLSDPARQARLLEIINHDIQRLDRLISDISQASRLDAELGRAEPSTVDLTRLVTLTAELYAPAAEQSGRQVRLVADVPPGAPLTVRGLESRLMQVMENLVGNALSFSPPGGVVRLALRAEGDVASLTVEDDGPGIPQGKLETIFERFYSDRPAGEAFGTHSGLGLSIAKQIVEGHGGTIRAANRLGAEGAVTGAIFTVCLPLGPV